MSNINYLNSKLLFIFSTQYEANENNEKIYINSNNLANFLEAGANGYVIVPKYNILDTNGDKMEETHIKNLLNFIAEIYNYYTTYKENDICNIWIGTPEISSNTANVKTNIYSYYDELKNYVTYCKTYLDTLNPSIWTNCIKGFYYNQESIYCDEFDYNTYTNNDEVKLMNDVSYYIHKNENIKKDLIWAPYFPTQDAENLTEAEIIKRIAHIIGGTTCFDCAYLQAGYITAISETYRKLKTETGYIAGDYKKENPYANINMSSAIETATNFKQRLLNAEKNLFAISKTLSNDTDSNKSKLLYYRDAVETDVNVANYATCVVGAEYEYDKTVASSNEENKMTDVSFLIEACVRASGDTGYTYNELKYLNKYKNSYGNYVGNRPMAIYVSFWPNSVDECINVIKEVFSSENITSETEISSTSTNYSGTLASYYTEEIYDECYNEFYSPSNTGFTLSFANNTMNKYKLDSGLLVVNEVLKADNPSRFWIDDLTYDITEGDEQNITEVTINAVYCYSIDELDDKHTKFYSDYATVKNTISSLILAKNVTNSTSNKFVLIHNWLVENVTYTEDTSNTDYSCTYGAIASDVRTANSKGFAMTLALLCKAFSIPCLSVNGYKGAHEHSWNYVKLDDEWRFVDASLNIPDEEDNYRYRYFLRKRPDSYIPSALLACPKVSEENYIKYGDANQDGVVSSADESFIYQYVLNNTSVDITPLGLIAADVTGDGVIDTTDVTNLQSKVLNDSFELPVEAKIKTYL